MPTALLAVVCAPALLTAAILYFPTTVGATRVLRITAGDTSFETTETVTGAVAKGGTHTVTVERRRAGAKAGATTQVLEVSARGVYRVDTVGAAVPVLKLGRAGTRWVTRVAGTDGRPGVGYVSTLGPAERVTVPAGTYKAVRVERTVEADGRRLASTSWFAPGVGVVKVVLHGPDGPEQTTVLQSFSLGK